MLKHTGLNYFLLFVYRVSSFRR